MSGLILHHYGTSPFSEKVRLMLGLKGLAWAVNFWVDPVAGTLAALASDRVVVARDTFELGKTHIHFPRAGYSVGKA